MERGNHPMTQFILVGFTTDPVMQLVLFGVFLRFYSVTMVGNTTLVVLICNNSRLHTPMYFFIGNLVFLDLWYSSVYTPKILVICISEDKSISFAGCVAQFFFSAGLAYSECFLLAAMAYDCYVTISKPLLYSQAMSIKLCTFLVAASYLGGFTNSSFITKRTFALEICGGNITDDFFCDFLPLMKITCGRKDCFQAVVVFILTSNVIAPTLFILAIYLFIIIIISKIHSTQGPLKAFSTCSSHLTSLTLYYGSILYTYARPSSRYSLDRDKITSIFYTVVFPMLNSMIYSLRNKDVK